MTPTFNASPTRRAWLSSWALAGGVLILWTTSLATAPSIPAAPSQQSAASPAQGHPAQFRVLRSLCGSKSTGRGSQFQILDPRNVFHVPEDHQIIVLFEWEGPPGSHHAEGTWRSPDGKVVVTSDFDLDSTGTHYMGYWTLAIPESIATGLWALEATIDGQPAGTQTFQIVSDRKPAPPAGPPMPTPAEVYQRAAAASVFVTSLDGNQDAITRGFGFFIDKNTLVTSFQVIDGATSLRVDFADGSSATVNDVVAWNRPQDWAILKVDSGKVQPLEKAPPDSWKIGDLCYVLTTQGKGSRTIQSVNLTGLQGTVKSEQRLTVSAYGGQGALGAPLLDSYGRVIGVLGGTFTEMSSARMGSWTSYVSSEQISTPLGDPSALPLAQIPQAVLTQPGVSLADLAAQGVLIAPLPRESQVATGSLCEDFRKMGSEAIVPLRTTGTFSHKQGSLALVLIWAPNKKLKSTQQVRIYDANNHAVEQTAPAKINLQPRVTLYSAWKMPLASLQPGVYRADVLVDGQPEWRQFFRLVD